MADMADALYQLNQPPDNFDIIFFDRAANYAMCG